MSKVDYIPDDPKKFKILFMSNSVYSPSGYGVQSNGMLYDWVKHYDVREATNYGLAGRMIGLNGLMIYPAIDGDLHGDKTSRLIFQNWKPHLYFTLYDIWMGAYTDQNPNSPIGLSAIHPYWIPIVMVDHDPVPEGTVQQCMAAYRTLTPTKFGEKQLRDRGVRADYIPFGVSTKVWKPVESEDEKRANRPWLNERGVPLDANEHTDITEDSFLLMMNGANKDPMRKGFKIGRAHV